jgi:hypothetical protein
MLRRVVFVLVVCSCVGIAFGAATKIRWFENIAEPNPDADGMAILNYVQGQNNISAQIILSDLLANAQYVVTLREPNTWSLDESTKEVVLVGGFFPLSAENQETDGKGHLTFHSSTTPDSGDYSDCDVLVFRQCDWAAAKPFPPSPTEYRIPVRLIGYNGTPAPE